MFNNDQKSSRDEKIISSHPFFSKLDKSDLTELLKFAFKKKLSKNQVIVSQGEAIDSVYLIIEGDVEVATQIINPSGGFDFIPKLILGPGDAIGLSDTDFFSKNGVRTATLTTLSEVILIGWPIETLIEFLRSLPYIDNLIIQSASQILRVNFIKKLSFFTNLSTEQTIELAQVIEEKEIKAGTILFHQDEMSDECYLIQSGKVEISIRDKSGSIYKTINLETPMLFGEMAFLSNSPRSATATMIETGNLLILKKALFQNILQSHASVAESIVTLAMERSHPVHAKDVLEYPHVNSDDQDIVILKNAKLKRYYQLSPLGLCIWNQINGNQTIEEIITKVLDQYGPPAVDEAYRIIFDLSDSGFVDFPSFMQRFLSQSTGLQLSTESSILNRIKIAIKKISRIKLIFTDIDKAITTIFNPIISFFYTSIGKWIVLSIILLGLMILPLAISQMANIMGKVNNLLLLVLAIFISNYLLVVIHELGHAFTVKSYGREVHKAGIIFYWLGLFAFVDTSDMWLSARKARVKVALAGPVTDLLLAGISSLCAFMISNPELKCYFLGLSLLLYYGVATNINPIDENDGYHALSNIFKIQNLRKSSLNFLGSLKLDNLFDNEFIKLHRAEFIFWTICFLSIIFKIVLVFIAQYLLRKILPLSIFGIHLENLNWIIPLCMLVYFIFKIAYLLKEKNQGIQDNA